MTGPLLDWPAELAWQDDSALCAQTDSELFFGDKGSRSCQDAKKLCAACPLLEPCRDYALHHAVLGVWGGTTAQQRRALRKTLCIEPKPLNIFEADVTVDHGRGVSRHGTDAGARAHWRAGEKPCEPCREASNRAQLDRVRRRNQKPPTARQGKGAHTVEDRPAPAPVRIPQPVRVTFTVAELLAQGYSEDYARRRGAA